ncbi:MAG: O-methyltransferase [Acidobacteria bacterium]|nr:O-methyltransferase [Acidobacteriota bacterium]
MGWKNIPFFRWSFVRMFLGIKHLTTEWQVGDGREAKLADYVEANAKPGDAADAVRVIDEFAYNESFLINVGDEKGEILDDAVRRANAKRILELGTYCGYSSLRMAVTAPDAHIYSIEFNADNADIARRIHRHAGVGDRITVVVGTLGDGGQTVDALESEHGFTPGSVDLVFLDHAKEAYLSDIHLIVERGWLRPGALAVADNVKFPGAPEYHAYMKEHEGRLWKTEEHETHVEYQTMIKDLVLVSEYLGES